MNKDELRAKLAAGHQLTQEERDFLRQTMPAPETRRSPTMREYASMIGDEMRNTARGYGDFARSAGDAFFMGFGPQVAAGLGNPGDYTAEVARQQEERRARAQRNPGADMVGGMVGAVAGSPLSGGVKAASLLKEGLASGSLGAVQGALSALGYGEPKSWDEAYSMIKQGGGIGAMLGFAAPAATRGVVKAADALESVGGAAHQLGARELAREMSRTVPHPSPFMDAQNKFRGVNSEMFEDNEFLLSVLQSTRPRGPAEKLIPGRGQRPTYNTMAEDLQTKLSRGEPLSQDEIAWVNQYVAQANRGRQGADMSRAGQVMREAAGRLPNSVRQKVDDVAASAGRVTGEQVQDLAVAAGSHFGTPGYLAARNFVSPQAAERVAASMRSKFEPIGPRTIAPMTDAERRAINERVTSEVSDKFWPVQQAPTIRHGTSSPPRRFSEPNPRRFMEYGENGMPIDPRGTVPVEDIELMRKLMDGTAHGFASAVRHNSVQPGMIEVRPESGSQLDTLLQTDPGAREKAKSRDTQGQRKVDENGREFILSQGGVRIYLDE